MKFFKYLEAKFTEHSLAQSNENFSIPRDGEQKATQTYIHLGRQLAKWYSFFFALPAKYLLCKVHILKFPEESVVQIEKFTELRKAQAEATRQLEAEKQQLEVKGDGKVVSIAANKEQSPQSPA